MTSALHARAKVVAVTGALLGTAAAFVPSGLIFRENRVAAGIAQSLATSSGAWGAVLVATWVLAGALALAPLRPRWRGISVSLLGGAGALVALAGSGGAAATYAAGLGDISRVSLGVGFWLSLFAAYVVIFAATAWLEAGLLRTALTYLPVGAATVLFASGRMSGLAIMREYANNSEDFAAEFRLHLTYVAGAVGVGLVLGVLLGLLAVRSQTAEASVFGILNVLQVLPTLAFIGLMYPVLSALSENIPALAAAGVRGVGWAPVLIVLSAYAVYPIARNVHSAITTLDPAVVDAAKGMGMGRARRLFEIELPLALPVIIAGVRIASVQTTAGAILAGLVGGGGLGTFVFLGAGETAMDLILLGVIPIVALALFFDRVVLALERAASARGATA